MAVALVFCVAVAGDVWAAPTIDELMANVRHATGGRPAKMGFRQYVTLQALFFRWQFHADVVRQDDQLHVTVYNAPSFVGGDFSGSLLEVSEGLDNFDLQLVDEVLLNGERYYVVDGVSRVEGGARRGKIWINARTWLVERAELEYPWGTLTIEQRFRVVNGYVVLSEQQASVSRLGARARVRYDDYWFAGGE